MMIDFVNKRNSGNFHRGQISGRISVSRDDPRCRTSNVLLGNAVPNGEVCVHSKQCHLSQMMYYKLGFRTICRCRLMSSYIISRPTLFWKCFHKITYIKSPILEDFFKRCSHISCYLFILYIYEQLRECPNTRIYYDRIWRKLIGNRPQRNTKYTEKPIILWKVSLYVVVIPTDIMINYFHNQNGLQNQYL